MFSVSTTLSPIAKENKDIFSLFFSRISRKNIYRRFAIISESG